MKNISIIGGDLRLKKLSELLLNDGIKVNTYFLYDNENCKDYINNINDIVISSIPFSKDGIYVYTPFSNNKITIDELFKNMQNKILIAGALNDDINIKAKKYNIKVIDIMKEEKLAILNAILTAEGTIQIISEETLQTIYDSNILILGFGRIGKILAHKLKAFGAIVDCEARRQSDIAWIRAYSYNPILLDELNKKLANKRYDVIINTIPTLILDKEKIININKRTLIIDLASMPGGVDFEEAKKKGLKVIRALGLPR